MKYLEEIILGTAIAENRFDELSFLEVKDFVCYGAYWQLALNSKGDLVTMLKNYPDEAQKNILITCGIWATNYPHQFAFKLIELRFKRLFKVLLVNLSESSKSVLESEILIEAKNSIDTVDIFDLSDGLIEYIGYQITSETETRIKDFISYRDSRIKKIKDHELTRLSK